MIRPNKSRHYTALIFDLCDTLMPYDEDRMPCVVIRGEHVRTTSSLLFDAFQECYTPISYESFHDHFVATKEAITALRKSGEEIPSSVRFAQFLDRLKIGPSRKRDEIHKKLMQIHLDCVAGCLYCPDENRTLLVNLHKKYKIGLVTNFDDVNTVYRVLEREKVRSLFDTILISAAFGLRKPRKEIFLAAAENLGVHPMQALFIGDSLISDMTGAQGVGMDTVWINPDGASPLKERPHPILKTVLELPSVLAMAAATPGPQRPAPPGAPEPPLPLVAVEVPTSEVLPNTTCSVVSLPPRGGL